MLKSPLTRRMESRSARNTYNRLWMRASRDIARMNTANETADDTDDDPVLHEGPADSDGEPDTHDDTEIDNNDVQHDEDVFQNSIGDDNEDRGDATDYKNDQNYMENDDDLEDIDSDIPITSEESEGESDDDDTPASFKDQLAMWVNDYQIKHNAADSLLKLLQRNGHPELPASARTLLCTVRHVQIRQVSDMDYIYFNLVEELIKAYRFCKPNIGNNMESLDIGLNIDGIPLFKASSSCLWPILCSITNVSPVHVFPVALTYGSSKPSDLDFLLDTVRDLERLLVNGLTVDDKIIPVRVKCIICDAPARSFVKRTKLYSGYHGCDQCNQRGNYTNRRITYQQVVGLEKRTDESFRSQTDEEHHRGETPFLHLPIDMIKTFPLDYMHSSCLGVMRKLLLIWIRGKGRLLGVRMSAVQVQHVSDKLIGLKSAITKDFQRKPRSLREIDRWKATEFRQFLLYTGKLVLDGILRRDLFEHFKVLSVATCILVSPNLNLEYNQYASQLLIYFVEHGRVLYGDEFLIYNVHSMLHLAGVAEEFGDLDSCSAFPYENYLQRLKKLVRSGKRPIVQIAKRLSEQSVGTIHPRHPPEECNISCNKPNNCYFLSDTTCCDVQEKTNEKDGHDDTLFLCRTYTRGELAFNTPCDSKLINVLKVRNRNTSMKLIPSRSLKKKAMKFDLDQDNVVFMALLHRI